MNPKTHFDVKPGQIIRHFKRDLCDKDLFDRSWYLYQVIGVASHTESGEPMMIYQALYDGFKMYARPLSMVSEPVDKTKYPRATQEHRFELASIQNY